MNTGKNKAQSYNEIAESVKNDKEIQKNTKKGINIYKAQSGEYQDGKITEVINATTNDLIDIISGDYVSLEDTKEVQARTIAYLRACEEASAFPSMSGLARALGYSTRALNLWIQNKSDTATGKWLEIYRDTCADIVAQSALKNNANTVFSIFISKAMYGLRDTNELVISPADKGETDRNYDADEIKKRYM